MSKIVRKTIEKAGGTMPEALPLYEKIIKQINQDKKIFFKV